jgi:hypothetical protein
MREQLSLVAREELDKLFENPDSMPPRSTPVSDALKTIGACEKSSFDKDLAVLIHRVLTGEKSTAGGSAIHSLW